MLWFWILLGLLLCGLLFLLILFYVGVCRWPDFLISNAIPLGLHGDWARRVREGVAWFRQQDTELVRIRAYDGVKLAARFLPADLEQPKGSIILVHGWRSSGLCDFSCAYKYYHDLGYNLLNVFQRGHGESGGRFTSFGIKERYDCQAWAWYLAKRLGPEQDIFLSGMSMGTATVLMATGLELPGNIRGIVADCGFNSPWDEMAHVLKHRIHLPVHPILELEDFLCRHLADFSFREYSAAEALAGNKIPVLFIHGLADTFVPPEMSRQNYAACAGEKEIILVEGAAHGLSFLADEARVSDGIENWLARWGTFSPVEASNGHKREKENEAK